MWRKFQSSVSYKTGGCFVVVLVGWFSKGEEGGAPTDRRSLAIGGDADQRLKSGRGERSLFCFKKKGKEAPLPDCSCSVDAPVRKSGCFLLRGRRRSWVAV